MRHSKHVATSTLNTGHFLPESADINEHEDRFNVKSVESTWYGQSKKLLFLNLTALEVVQSEERIEYRIAGHLSHTVYAIG
jgi:hypothetical protein